MLSRVSKEKKPNIKNKNLLTYAVPDHLRDTYLIHKVAMSSTYPDTFADVAYRWTLDDLSDALDIIEIEEQVKERYERHQKLKNR